MWVVLGVCRCVCLVYVSSVLIGMIGSLVLNVRFWVMFVVVCRLVNELGFVLNVIVL